MRWLAASVVVLLTVSSLAGASHFVSGHRPWSTVADGTYALAPVEHAFFTASDGTPISYAVYRPVEKTPGERFPVILTAGPYFGLLEEPVDVPSKQRLSGFLVDNYVSHGYAVVAAAIRGTERSGGCVELMSDRETKDVDELVTFLAGRSWSTGKVGMTGKSYDGGLAWGAAQYGNPALATIVPIAGLVDQGGMLYNDGAAEYRAPVFHSVVYYPFGFGLEPQTPSNGNRPLDARAASAVCPEVAKGQAAALTALATGRTDTDPVSADYWEQRDFRAEVLENYRGSVFVVHGLRDYNTNPSNTVGFANELKARGNDVEMLLGQWQHHYPDDVVKGNPVWTHRGDFAQTLKSWFDKHLKGAPVSTGAAVEVADFWYYQNWRSTAAWPDPTGVRTYGLANAGPAKSGNLVEGQSGQSFTAPIATPLGLGTETRQPCVSENAAAFRYAIPQGFRLSGVPTADFRVEGVQSGVLVAQLCLRTSWGTTYLVTQGGTNLQTPAGDGALGVPVLPQDVHVEMEPAEFVLDAGHELILNVQVGDFFASRGAEGYFPAQGAGTAVLTAGTLALPVR